MTTLYEKKKNSQQNMWFDVETYDIDIKYHNYFKSIKKKNNNDFHININSNGNKSFLDFRSSLFLALEKMIINI